MILIWYDGAKKIAVLRDGSLAEKYVWQPESSGDADVILFDGGGVYATDANKNVTAYFIIPEWPEQPNGTYFTYTPFGEPVNGAKRFAFSSEEWLGDYGLLRYLYRDYSPNLKRFLTRDPIGEAGGTNLYNFVGNSPVTRWDDKGEGITEFVNWILTGKSDPPPEELHAAQRGWTDAFGGVFLPEGTLTYLYTGEFNPSEAFPIRLHSLWLFYSISSSSLR